ncbi:ribonuclease T2 [Meredithblackwellia eburnea MCA 4105]
MKLISTTTSALFSLTFLSHSVLASSQREIVFQSPSPSLTSDRSRILDTCPENPGPSCPEDPSADKCCVNSPGSYFAQTQFWDASPPIGPVDSWTEHGLWADYCTEDPHNWPYDCDSKRFHTGAELRKILQNETELVDYMEKYWIPDAGSTDSFWSHEWNKHGTCVSTMEPHCYPDYKENEEVVEYFKKAVSIFKSLPTYDWLKEHDIVPSRTKTYTLDQLQAAARDKFEGHEAIWGCRGNQLNQVFWGFITLGPVRENGQFIPADPGSRAVNTCPKTGIVYQPKDGSRPGPTPPGPPGRPGARHVWVEVEGKQTGCLISSGKWMTGVTCGSYQVVGSERSDFFIKSSKGPCQVSTTGLFICGGGLQATTLNLDADGFLKLTSPSFKTFYAPAIPSGTQQVGITTGKSQFTVKLRVGGDKPPTS